VLNEGWASDKAAAVGTLFLEPLSAFKVVVTEFGFVSFHGVHLSSV
jgi:hypothetical protein